MLKTKPLKSKEKGNVQNGRNGGCPHPFCKTERRGKASETGRMDRGLYKNDNKYTS